MPEAESGRGWTDDPYTEAMRDALVQKVGEQQRRVAAAAGTGLGGRLDRGQHQKMLLGAVGRLRVFDQVPAAVRLGPLAAPFALPVACRFSNGQPCPFSDKTPDVRGVALKFFSPQGAETDILATNEGGRSHAKDAESFMAFADILVAKIERGGAGAFEELLQELREGKLTAGEFAHMGAVILKETGLHSPTQTRRRRSSPMRAAPTSFVRSSCPDWPRARSSGSSASSSTSTKAARRSTMPRKRGGAHPPS